ncbi:MAG: ABC transporter ATP-binding protein [Candidatus Eremiobacteraeota bacterium]|nr:ABC transporter ATP-binding protein [Candidatus Eremiobacteraeota bacterium]
MTISLEDAREFAIETRDLSKRYGGRLAVAGLTMNVARGEVFGFLGPNGAGKTTAVKMLLGLVHRTGGDAAILGRPLGTIEARRHIGYLPELFRYQDWLTAREILHWHASIVGVPRTKQHTQVDGILERIGLAGRADDRVGVYSKGMQQRLGIGVALVGDPQLIFLDEPTSALDPVGRADIRDLIAGLKAQGTTVFLNSHLLTEVESVCDRVAVIDRGKIIAIGDLSELLGRFALRITFERMSESLIAALRRDHAILEGSSGLFYGVDDARIPDLIASLVAAGARITRVEPMRLSLEERFLELLRTENERTFDRVAGPS